MSKKSSMHGYFNRAKERMDEMDAALASVESSAEKVKADSKEKARRFVADLRKRRDEFEAAAKKLADAGEAAVERSAAHLEKQWEDFDAQVQAYFDTVDKQIEHRQAAFGKIAAVYTEKSSGLTGCRKTPSQSAESCDSLQCIQRGSAGCAAATSARKGCSHTEKEIGVRVNLTAANFRFSPSLVILRLREPIREIGSLRSR